MERLIHRINDYWGFTVLLSRDNNCDFSPNFWEFLKPSIYQFANARMYVQMGINEEEHTFSSCKIGYKYTYDVERFLPFVLQDRTDVIVYMLSLPWME